jgi:hypothetical protein
MLYRIQINVDDPQMVNMFLLKNNWNVPPSFVFPLTDIGGTKRRFNRSWLDKYQWMRYSVRKPSVL